MNPIQEWQSLHGLKADGIVGRMTANKFKEVYNLSRESAAHILGQSHLETGGFKIFGENLNYSWQSLVKVFGYYKRNPHKAIQHHRKPVLIANHAYANRGGNGSIASGDGWRFRGRGMPQITLKNNYREVGNHLGYDLVKQPELLLRGKIMFDACVYWFQKNIPERDLELFDQGTMRRVSGWVNRGNPNRKALHLNKRIHQSKRFYHLLKD